MEAEARPARCRVHDQFDLVAVAVLCGGCDRLGDDGLGVGDVADAGAGHRRPPGAWRAAVQGRRRAATGIRRRARSRDMAASPCRATGRAPRGYGLARTVRAAQRSPPRRCHRERLPRRTRCGRLRGGRWRLRRMLGSRLRVRSRGLLARQHASSSVIVPRPADKRGLSTVRCRPILTQGESFAVGGVRSQT